jgi:cobalt-zinc-cadmium efflux system protein
LHLLFDGVPPHIELGAVRAALLELPQVTALHDLHVWALASMETALTAHLVIPGGHRGDGFLHEVSHELEHRFHIGHATVQVETGAHAEHCVDCA